MVLSPNAPDSARWYAGLFLLVLIGVFVVRSILGLGAGSSAPVPIDESAGRRIVSLSPALTRMVMDLGHGAELVAVGRFDPEAGRLPVAGDYDGADYEKLIALKPTRVLMQSAVSKRLLELGKSHGWRVHRYQIDRVQDVLEVLTWPDRDQQGGQSVSQVVGEDSAGLKLMATLRDRLKAAKSKYASDKIEAVLLLVGGDGLRGVRPNTFLGELLEHAGAVNVLEPATFGYPELDGEKVIQLNPRLILRVTGSKEQIDPGKGLPQSLRGRVVLLKDDEAMLPSTRMADVVERLAEALRPNRTPESGSPKPPMDK